MKMSPDERLSLLRQGMRRHKLDAYLVPSSDPHQSEYVAAHWQARAWLSGFTGSAGTVVVTQTHAGLWTDARYYIRANQALEGSAIRLFKADGPNYDAWLLEQLAEGATLGFDASVVSAAEFARLERTLSPKNIKLNGDFDLFADIWAERPALPSAKVLDYELCFAGEARQQKLTRIRKQVKEKRADTYFLASLDEIAWTFNLRGRDIPFNPVFLAYALIKPEDAYLFTNVALDKALAAELSKQNIWVLSYEQLEPFLKDQKLKSVFLDPEKISHRLKSLLQTQSVIVEGPSLAHTMKAIKNEMELAGHRRAQVRDGVAMLRWLMWLENALLSSEQTEISVAKKLDEFRAEGEYFQGPSFDTIVGYAANSAVGHYKAYPETTPILKPEGILLVDSGGQYRDGTTDITRTLSLGKVTNRQKHVYTTVLKSLIKLSTLEFPKGTRGDQLDAIAREPLWRMGWDCRHGIGHGVGHYLNVHEGPQRFSKTDDTVFQLSSLSSCEPGVYFEAEFGVRLENLLLTEYRSSTAFAEVYGFETMTFFPFALELIDGSLLTERERDWLNAYHQQVFTMLSPLLSRLEQTYLSEMTRFV